MTFDHSLLIAAAPTRVMGAFFDPAALSLWWQVVRSLTTPRSLGVYALEWEPTPFRDEVLGPLGGVFHGTVVDLQPGCEFFVAGAYWLPPEGDPIGPMSLQVHFTLDGPATRVRVCQQGYEESPRWRRYYEVVTSGWLTSLRFLKMYFEEGPAVVRAELFAYERTLRRKDLSDVADR